MSGSESRPLRVFLCHASADKLPAYRLYRYLQEKGMDPWLDVEKLVPGQKWQMEIPRALYASDAVLVILSKNSITKEGFVQREIKFALDKALEMPEDRIFIIPARLEECNVPQSLRGYHWVDLFRRNWDRRLLQSLNERALQLGLMGPVLSDLEETRPPIRASSPVQAGTSADAVYRNLPGREAAKQEEPVVPGDARSGGKKSRLLFRVSAILLIVVSLIFFSCMAALRYLTSFTRVGKIGITDLSTMTPALPTETPDPNLIRPGTYIVGTEIQAGLYRGAGRQDGLSCQWTRLKSLEQDQESILANGLDQGQFYVEVKETDLAFKTDCPVIRLDTLPTPVASYPDVISPGTYLVGREIRPGTYRTPAGSDTSGGCYWSRLRNVAGDDDAILVNEFLQGQIYVEVSSSDFAFETTCELEWFPE